jgi:hypothetical protein
MAGHYTRQRDAAIFAGSVNREEKRTQNHFVIL